MLNPFFLQGSKTEQGLIQDLVNEHLRIFGVDVYYLPRQYITEKTIIKEVIESEFNNAYPIEAYVNTTEGYKGQGTLLSKFGIQELDDLILTISRERYENYIYPLIKNLPDIKLADRPKEGDLIYFPLGDRLFEIKYVEHESPFYQLQRNYTYELTCELFRYEDEVIDTNVEFIDDNIQKEGHIQTLLMVGSGSSASAISSIVNGGVRYVSITNRGHKYKMPPEVIFSMSFVGETASGTASMIDDLVDFCDTDKDNYRVQKVYIKNAGSSYIKPPKLIFIGGGGEGASGISSIGNGVIGIITVTNGGSGYVNPPNITFSGSCVVSASATAVVSSSGTITSIQIIDGGLGYTNAPSIIIDPPQNLVGFGTYIYNEIITGSTSGTTARVKSWNDNSNFLKISNITGEFLEDEIIVGSESGAEYKLKQLYDDNLEDPSDPINSPSDPYSENKQIQIESNNLLDFNEKNPFGMP